MSSAPGDGKSLGDIFILQKNIGLHLGNHAGQTEGIKNKCVIKKNLFTK